MYIESLAQAWTCFPMCLLGTCILAYTVKQYRLHLKLNTLNDNVKLTYVSILVSLACKTTNMQFLLPSASWLRLSSGCSSIESTRSKIKIIIFKLQKFSLCQTVSECLPCKLLFYWCLQTGSLILCKFSANCNLSIITQLIKKIRIIHQDSSNHVQLKY